MHRWEDIKTNLKQIQPEHVDYINLIKDNVQRRFLVIIEWILRNHKILGMFWEVERLDLEDYSPWLQSSM
jgi:hypothetical protein